MDWARITKFAPNMHLGILKMGVIDLDLQCHLAISTREMAFSVALVYWSMTTKGCYTSQTGTCSCLNLADDHSLQTHEFTSVCICKPPYMGSMCVEQRNACVQRYNESALPGATACHFPDACIPQLGTDGYSCTCPEGIQGKSLCCYGCGRNVGKSMGQCNKDVTPLLTHCSYIFLALTHWNSHVTLEMYLCY